MPAKSHIDLAVTALNEKGEGIAESFAVPGLLPGERWRFPISAWRRYQARELGSAELLKLGRCLRPAPERAAPLCEYFGCCGGCQLQHWDYAAQLLWKQKRMEQALSEFGVEIPPLLTSGEPWHYRRRIQLHPNARGELGFHASGSRKVLPIRSCAIASAAINAQLPAFCERAAPERRYELTEHLGQVEFNALTEEREFLQVNAAANARLLDVLKSHFAALRPAKVLELYAGGGNFTHFLASLAQRWVAVESNGRAVESARALSPPNVEWVAQPANRALSQLKNETWDLILLDPPRSGAGDCLELLPKSRNLIYISCNLDILPRELKQLRRRGYALDALQGFDFFPQTTHVETLAALSCKLSEA